jgi:tRNA threonylcarbamoyladenosine biosynthesis protein TsaE
MQISITCPEDLVAQAPKIWAQIGTHKIVLLKGPLGAGKTTLVRILLSHKGINETGSPTYSIINEYKDSKGNTYYHCDFYRLKNINEAIDIGTEDYLYSGNVCFIEWPEKIEQLIPENFVTISIEIDGFKRYISIN